MFKIRLDPADTVFSQFIRLRDKRCMRCGSPVEINAKGLPVSHQASHYWSRGREMTRFDPENVDTLCYGCHQLWGHGDLRDGYKSFKIKQLGEDGFKRLDARAHTPCKKDRNLALLVARQMLKDILKNEQSIT